MRFCPQLFQPGASIDKEATTQEMSHVEAARDYLDGWSAGKNIFLFSEDLVQAFLSVGDVPTKLFQSPYRVMYFQFGHRTQIQTLSDPVPFLGGLKLGEMAQVLCSDDDPHSYTERFPGNWPAFLAEYLNPCRRSSVLGRRRHLKNFVQQNVQLKECRTMTTVHTVKRRGEKIEVTLHWKVESNLRTWQENRPYGMGMAAEPMAEAEIEDVEFQREAWPFGFEHEELTNAELKTAEEDAFQKAQENPIEHVELSI